MAAPVPVRAWYYQHHDADFTLEVPEEGFGAWQSAQLELAPDHTAVVVMHAWDCGEQDQFPGWYRAVPYIPRAAEIAWRVFPALLAAARRSPLPLLHVVAGGKYYQHLPGYQAAVKLAGPDPAGPEQIPSDPVRDKLTSFKPGHVFPGENNLWDVNRGFARLDFAPEARPRDDEYIAESGHQLFAVCKALGVNHLIYAGFALDGCLLLSPGGMFDMQQRGFLCSAFRQATTAIEMKETARQQLAKEIGLWRVALLFGFVFDVTDFIHALPAK